MTTWTIRDADPAEREALVAVWRRAVEATHHFLGPLEIDGLEATTRAQLSRAALRVAAGPAGPVGFLGGSGGAVDALFVDPGCHGQGIGSALLADAAAHHPVLTVDVHAQNPAAHAWYVRRGYTLTGERRPFPYAEIVNGRALRDDLYFVVLAKDRVG